MVNRTPIYAAAASMAATLASSLAACKPDIDSRTSLVDSPRVLAVMSEPAEAPPTAPVKLTALFVDANGAIPQPVDWAFCDDRKPLAELEPVSPRCLQHTGDFFEPIGVGAAVSGVIPQKACRQFGPDVPEAVNNQPPGRPVDPDPTGGYYQPIRILGQSPEGEVASIARTRITCTVAGAAPEQLTDLKQRNHVNVNPIVDSLAPFDVASASATASVGQVIPLRASWAACTPDMPACTGAEHYASFDPGTQAVVGRSEGLRLSWFTTGGTFTSDHTGVEEGSADTQSANTWTAPSAPGLVHLWVVIRDDRGGAGWRSFDIDVK